MLLSLACFVFTNQRCIVILVSELLIFHQKGIWGCTGSVNQQNTFSQNTISAPTNTYFMKNSPSVTTESYLYLITQRVYVCICCKKHCFQCGTVFCSLQGSIFPSPLCLV